MEYPSRDSGDSVTHEQELVTFSSEESVESLHGLNGATGVSSDDASQSAGPLVQSNLIGLNGIPLFQGYCFISLLLRNAWNDKMFLSFV